MALQIRFLSRETYSRTSNRFRVFTEEALRKTLFRVEEHELASRLLDQLSRRPLDQLPRRPPEALMPLKLF